MTTEDRWVVWIEPFGPENEPVYMKVPPSTAVAVAKMSAHNHGYAYASDEDALSDFMCVHWAWFSGPEGN